MSGMFYHAESFNKPIDKWDISKVEYTDGMFAGAVSFDQSLKRWDIFKERK